MRLRATLSTVIFPLREFYVPLRLHPEHMEFLPPHDAREFLRHGLPVLGPFAGLESGPVFGGGEAFAVGRVNAESDGKSSFAELRVFFHREAFLQLHLGFRDVVDVADFYRAARPRDGCRE